jgi:hypothetical protein
LHGIGDVEIDVELAKLDRLAWAMSAVHFLRSREPGSLENALASAQKAHEADVQVQSLIRGDDY